MDGGYKRKSYWSFCNKNYDTRILTKFLHWLLEQMKVNYIKIKYLGKVLFFHILLNLWIYMTMKWSWKFPGLQYITLKWKTNRNDLEICYYRVDIKFMWPWKTSMEIVSHICQEASHEIWKFSILWIL